MADLISSLKSKICTMMNHSTKSCRQAEKLVELVFANWESSSDNWLTGNMLMSVNHVTNLDQWYATLNSILLKRSWEMEDSVTSSIQSFMKETIDSIRRTFSHQKWAQKDRRFLFLEG